MNIILWIIGYPSVGFIMGNIKWHLVYHTEAAKSGKWMREVFYWFFFPWRCFLNLCHHTRFLSFKDARSVCNTSIYDGIDDSWPSLGMTITCHTIFWPFMILWSLIALCIGIPLIFIVGYSLKWVIIPYIIKPIYNLLYWIVTNIFKNHPVT